MRLRTSAVERCFVEHACACVTDGAITHFYAAKADDPARCPEKTVPLWRYFNQANGSTVAPNHRYLLTRSVGEQMTSAHSSLVPTTNPWAAEGIALCVPE